MPHILETVMLICFGLSWPMALRRSWAARTARGKSLFFLCAIELGYIMGVAAKFWGGNANYVVIFYIVNGIMVALDIALYFRNRKLDRENAANA